VFPLCVIVRICVFVCVCVCVCISVYSPSHTRSRSVWCVPRPDPIRVLKRSGPGGRGCSLDVYLGGLLLAHQDPFLYRTAYTVTTTTTTTEPRTHRAAQTQTNRLALASVIRTYGTTTAAAVGGSEEGRFDSGETASGAATHALIIVELQDHRSQRWMILLLLPLGFCWREGGVRGRGRDVVLLRDFRAMATHRDTNDCIDGCISSRIGWRMVSLRERFTNDTSRWLFRLC